MILIAFFIMYNQLDVIIYKFYSSRKASIALICKARFDGSQPATRPATTMTISAAMAIPKEICGLLNGILSEGLAAKI